MGGPKLGSYVPLIMSFNNMISGIFEKFFFSIFMGKNAPKMAKINVRNKNTRVYIFIYKQEKFWPAKLKSDAVLLINRALQKLPIINQGLHL